MSLWSELNRVRILIHERFALAAGMITTFSIRIICAALSYLMFIAVGHVTDAAAYRDFAFLFTVVGFCAPMATLGSNQTVYKYLSMMVHEDHAEKYAFTRHVLRIVAVGIVLFALIAAVLITFGLSVRPSPVVYVLILATLALGAVGEILSAFYTVLGSVVMSVTFREMIWRVVLIAGVLLLYLVQGTVTLVELCIVFFLSYLAMAVAFSIRMREWLARTREAAGKLVMEIPRRQFWSFLGLAAVGMAIVHLDTLILGLAQQSTGLSAFFSAQRTTQVVLFFGQSVALIAGPIVSKEYALGNYHEITKLSRKTVVLAGLPTLALAGLIAVFASPIMGLFRPEFTGYAPLLQILLVGPLLLTLGGLHTVIPTFCGGEHIYLKWRLILIAAMIPIKVAVAMWGTPMEYALVVALDVLAITIMGLTVSRVSCRVPAI